jgi:K+-sensing histidine kinase KdpD
MSDATLRHRAGALWSGSAARRWLLVVGVPVVAGVALLPLRDHARNTNIALLLALVTVGISVLGGLAPGAVAGLATALTYNALFTRPYWSLRINDADDVETVLLLVLIGAAVGALVSWGRRQQREAARQEASARRLRRQAELTSGSETTGRLLQQAREELCDLLHVQTCLYEPGPPGGDVAVFTHTGVTVPGDSASTRPWVAVPVRRSGRIVGHFLIEIPAPIRGPTAFTTEGRQSALALADHIGVVLDGLSRP